MVLYFFPGESSFDIRHEIIARLMQVSIVNGSEVGFYITTYLYIYIMHSFYIPYLYTMHKFRVHYA